MATHFLRALKRLVRQRCAKLSGHNCPSSRSPIRPPAFCRRGRSRLLANPSSWSCGRRSRSLLVGIERRHIRPFGEHHGVRPPHGRSRRALTPRQLHSTRHRHRGQRSRSRRRDHSEGPRPILSVPRGTPSVPLREPGWFHRNRGPREPRVFSMSAAPRRSSSFAVLECTRKLLMENRKSRRLPNALPFSSKGRYVMVDSSTAGAARRPSFVSKAARPRLVDRRPRVDRPLSAATG